MALVVVAGNELKDPRTSSATLLWLGSVRHVHFSKAAMRCAASPDQEESKARTYKQLQIPTAQLNPPTHLELSHPAIEQLL